MPVAVREREAVKLPVEERIRLRAYELYVQRGCATGSEAEDWLQAEEEILAAQDREIEEGE